MAVKKCTGCSNGNNDKNKVVSYAAFESVTTMNRVTINKLITVIILLLVLLVGTNACWLFYESQFETVESTTTESYEITQDVDEGTNNCIIKDGEICNGKTDN